MNYLQNLVSYYFLLLLRMSVFPKSPPSRQVLFSAGSHMNITWTVAEGTDEECLTKDASDPGVNGDVTWVAAPSAAACVFPFRYDGVLHYGCTDPGAFADPAGANMCAVQTDDDYNAELMAACEERCHVQSKIFFFFEVLHGAILCWPHTASFFFFHGA